MPGPELSDNRRTRKKSRKASKNKGGFVVAILAAVSLICVAAALAISIPMLITDAANDPDYQLPVEQASEEPKDTGKIFANIFINNVHVGDLTKAEALEKVKKEVNSNKLEQNITFVNEDEKFTYKLSELGVNLDFDTAVNTAFLIGRGEDKSKNNTEIKKLETGKIDLEAAITYDKSKMNAALSELAGKVNKEAANATMERVNGEFVIVPEINGVQMDVEQLAEDISKAVESGSIADIKIVVKETLAEFTEQMFLEATKPIGSFYTVIAGSEAGRNKNLDTASGKINDYVVYPDEVFSTNKVFGEMTNENGYRMAPVIVGGELTNGMGGGVCQVSSTLYMALLYAEIEIVERQNHSQKVGYADYGYDATLAGDYIDLKFKNNTGHPLTIESYIEGNKLYVNIYGHDVHEPGRRLEFYNVFTGSVDAPGESIVDDPELPLGERVVKTTARNGVNYDLYKIVYNGSTEIEREHVNTSKYRARAAVVHVGTGAAAADAPTAENVPPAVDSTSNNPEATPAPDTENTVPPAETIPAPSMPTEMPTLNPPKEIYVPGNIQPPSEAPIIADPDSGSTEPPPVLP